MLIHRENTVKNKGIGHYMDQDLDRLRDLNDSKNKILNSMKSNFGNNQKLVMTKELKQQVKTQNILQAQLADVRTEVGKVIKRHRVTKAAYKTGIVGVEQPGDDPESFMFKQKYQELKKLRSRHQFYQKNRLKRKSLKLKIKNDTRTGN